MYVGVCPFDPLPDFVTTSRTLLGRVAAITGRRTTFWVMSSIPLGLVAGLIEIAFGYAVGVFLASWGLVPVPAIPAWLSPFAIHPTWFLLVIGALQAIVMFASLSAAGISNEAFSGAMRANLTVPLGSASRMGRVTIPELSGLLATSVPRAATYLSSVAGLIAAVGVILVTLAGLVHLSARLTVITLVLFTVLAIPVAFTRSRFQAYSADVYRNITRFQQGLIRAFRNREFLWITGRAGAETDRLLTVNSHIYRDYFRYVTLLNFNSAWPQFVGVCLVIALVKIVGAGGIVAPGVLVPFVYLVSRLATRLSQAITATGNMKFTRPYIRDLLAAVEAGDDVVTNSGATVLQDVDRIAVSNLEIGRDSALTSPISFAASAGELVWIKGDSGKGKTTLLLTLIGLVKPIGGRVQWNGVDVADIRLDSLRRQLAYSGADPFLIDGTVRDNILIGAEGTIADDEIWSALEAAACGFVRDLRGGLDFKLSDSGDGISAGQKQRLSIARAVLRSPRVLILDEAAANVDISTELAILDAIRMRLPNTMILAVSHRDSLERLATQVVEL